MSSATQTLVRTMLCVLLWTIAITATASPTTTDHTASSSTTTASYRHSQSKLINFWVTLEFKEFTSLENLTLAPSAGRKLKGKFFKLMVSGKFDHDNFLSIQPLSRCFNGGRCSDGVDSFSCVCEDGFSGEYCECTDAPEEGGDVTCLNVTAQVSYTLPPNFDDILLATTTTTQVS